MPQSKLEKTIKKVARKEIDKKNSKTAIKKFHRVTRAFSVLDYSGYIEDLSAISQGVTDSTRVGDNLVPRSLEVGFYTTPTTYRGTWRLIIFRWLDDSVPAASDILFEYGTLFATISSYQKDLRVKFNVLHDSLHEAQLYSRQNPGYRYVKIGKTPINYVAGGTTGFGKIYSLVINDAAIGAAPAQPILTYRLNWDE